MVSLNRKHERMSFFKYMSSSTAEIVLTDCTLRWSSPVEFNDPFDVPRELAFDITPEEIQQALIDKLICLIESPPENTEILSPEIKVLLEALKKNETDELKQSLINDLKEKLENHLPSVDSLLSIQELWREWLPEFRILCLSENHDKASMWYHYADKYKGVVLELLCDDKLDSVWLAAEKVQYPDIKPNVYTAKGWAELLIMPQSEAIDTILNTCLYTKSPDWSYEDEWRISSRKREHEIGTTSDYKISPNEFGDLYLGPHISPDYRNSLLRLSDAYPNITVFDTHIGLNREFKFIKING